MGWTEGVVHNEGQPLCRGHITWVPQDMVRKSLRMARPVAAHLDLSSPEPYEVGLDLSRLSTMHRTVPSTTSDLCHWGRTGGGWTH